MWIWMGYRRQWTYEIFNFVTFPYSKDKSDSKKCKTR